jgi:hypothetical protein
VGNATWVLRIGLAPIVPKIWMHRAIQRFAGTLERLPHDAIDELDQQGNPIIDDTLLILLNAHHGPLPFILPNHDLVHCWQPVLDTREATGRAQWPVMQCGAAYPLEARSLALLRQVDSDGPKKSATARLRIVSRLRLAISRLVRQRDV